MPNYDIIMTHSDLSRTVWTFMLMDTLSSVTLRLTSYQEQTRATTRHRIWTVARGWAVHKRRDGGSVTSIAQEPDVPPEILAQVRTAILDSIQLVRWPTAKVTA